MEDLIGSVIKNRYRVDKFLGRGGMAEVYKVWDKERAVPLAMKVLHTDLAEDRVFLRRFEKEAATLALLQHPHIVRTYGLEIDGRTSFLLMDYIEGSTLRAEIFDTEGPMPFKRILEIMQPVCSALHYAHQKNKVHCDIKPANIMVHKNGTILLADFGIAREAEGATTATLVGAGTPAYMAPEQVRGEDPTPQTDIYSLGVVLYEMLTGERPFTGERATVSGTSSEKVRWEQVNLKPMSPRRFNPQISEELEAVVLNCLEKYSLNRYAGALELLEALQESIRKAFSQEVGFQHKLKSEKDGKQDNKTLYKVKHNLIYEDQLIRREIPKAKLFLIFLNSMPIKILIIVVGGIINLLLVAFYIFFFAAISEIIYSGLIGFVDSLSPKPTIQIPLKATTLLPQMLSTQVFYSTKKPISTVTIKLSKTPPPAFTRTNTSIPNNISENPTSTPIPSLSIEFVEIKYQTKIYKKAGGGSEVGMLDAGDLVHLSGAPWCLDDLDDGKCWWPVSVWENGKEVYLGFIPENRIISLTPVSSIP